MVALLGCAEPRVLSGPCDGCMVALHPAGIADPSSDDFHGKLLRDTGWNFAACQKCHGEDFAGGASGKSCLSCHAEGPTACATCHREDNEMGAHTAHRGARVDCSECHRKPSAWDDAGHLDGAAEVTF